MENKRLNETYERPQAELIDIFPEEGVCTGSTESLTPGDGEADW